VGVTEFTVTDAEAVAEQVVVVFVTVTVYAVVELGETTLPFPVVLIGAAHEYVYPEVGLAVNVTEAPLQIIPSLLVVPDVSVKEIVGTKDTITCTVEVTTEVGVHPPLVTATSQK
jgi:hypothetical protein